jgi:hypothetical protein
MRTDRELLELAARAAGIAGHWQGNDFCLSVPSSHSWYHWNPLADDGDALRLAVKLHIDVYQSRIYDESCAVSALEKPHSQLRGDDPYAATRRAIVRAAAEIGAQVSPPALNTDKEGEQPTNNKGESNGQV